MKDQAFTRFDASEFLGSEEGIEEFVAAAFETGDPAFIAKSLGVVAKARNMTHLAAEIGMSRAALYKALSGEGNPELGTIMKVLKALGLRITSIDTLPPDGQEDSSVDLAAFKPERRKAVGE